MPRPTKDATHEVLERILEAMLERDEPITARAVIKRHPQLASASAITRNPARFAVLRRYVAKQQAMRQWAQRTQKRSKQDLAAIIATQEERISNLNDEVRTLLESHLHLISLVAEMGGVRRLRTFYEQQRSLRARLALSRALPPALLDK